MKNFMRLSLLSALGALVFATTSIPLVAQEPAKCTVTVKVTGIRNTQGNVLVALRSGPGTVVQGKTAEIDAKTMTAETTFTDIPEGTYDVAVIHDENRNGTLDFEPIGMPAEGYAHSNNPAKRPGEPSFDETKFTLTKPGKTIDVQLIYWP